MRELVLDRGDDALQPCPGFFHLPPSAHPFAFGADSRIGPDGSSTTSTTWRPCRSQKCSGSCRACRSAKIASAANYRATHRVTAASRCADAITQHKRCDRSLYAGGTSYSVTGKTARVTGITARSTCHAVLPSECLVPLPPLLRKELGRSSVAAVVRTGRSLPGVTHGGSCRAPIAGGPCRSAERRGIRARDEQTS